MQDIIHSLQAQLCPIPSESTWSLGTNERCHKYLHKAIDCSLLPTHHTPVPHLFFLLSNIYMVWDLAIHVKNIVPHYHDFGTMALILVSTESSTNLAERQYLMTMARETIAQCRAQEIVRRVNLSYKRTITTLKHFVINQFVWFHRRLHGWREGIVSKIDPPTTCVSHKSRQYPTHEAHVSPHFGELSNPPTIINDTYIAADSISHPDMFPASAPHVKNPTFYFLSPGHGRAPFSNIFHGIYTSSQFSFFAFSSQFRCSFYTSMIIRDAHLGYIYCDEIFVTTLDLVHNLNTFSKAHQAVFSESIKYELVFRLKDCVRSVRLHSEEMCSHTKLQQLKYIFNTKRSTHTVKLDRHRARLVSASH